MAHEHHPNIDVPRLFNDLAIADAELESLGHLNIPADVRVPSVSSIKTDTVWSTLGIVRPGEVFEVVGVKVPSGVAEQPLGQTAIDGALNRLHNGIQAREQIVPGEAATTAWFSIENGLFRIAQHGALLEARDRRAEEVMQFTEGADLSPDFDPDAEYEDRAVAVLHLPGYHTIVQISSASEAVRFPKTAVLAAYNDEGGFDQHTAGSKLAEMGLVRDKQNPHSELTDGRLGGPLPRQDQMARVMARALMRLVG